jgi:hypothetical protein
MPPEPSLEQLDNLGNQYRNDYSGKWITTAWFHYGAALYAEAAHAFERARDGFGQKSSDWKHLEAWRIHAEAKIPKKKK